MAKLTDDALISILRKEENVAQNWQDSQLLDLRQKALSYYDRDVATFGHEEGQSSVVTSEFADTVESVMPGMMRVFASGDEIVEFTPMEEADEQAAKEASQYVPHVVMRENDGWRIYHTFIKDALMYRLATAVVDVVEVEKAKRDPVAGWTEEEMAMAEQIAMEQGATEVSFEVTQDPMPAPMSEPMTGDGMPMMAPEPLPTFSGTIIVTRKKKRVVADNVAPEDLLISPANVRDIDEASFCGYRKEVTASDLRMLGVSQEEIDGLSATRTSSPEEDQRQGGEGESQPRKDDQRRLWLVVAYVRADDNGDGISEMLRVVYAHAGGMAGAIIERMEWEEDEAPITIGSVILMSHTIVGRSLFDQTAEFQDVGTAVTRGMLDNVYATNRPRPLINGRVNINQVLDWTPGMPVQMDGNGDVRANIGFLQVPSIIEPALAALGYLENKRDQRTGTSRIGNNMDSDALNDASNMTMGGTQMVMSAAQERQELMANTLAATAFIRFLRHIYRAIKRAADGPVKYYAKGEWQECDPTKWPDDMHLIVAAGSGNKMQEQASLIGIGQAQEKIGQAQGGFAGPVVTLEHIANTGRKLAEVSGQRATSKFFASDKDIKQALAQPKEPPKDPKMVEVEAKIVADQAAFQAEQALSQQRLQADIANKRQSAAIDLQIRREQAQLDLQLAREAAAQQLQLKREEAALNAQLKREELAQEAVLGAMEIKANANAQGATQQREQSV